MKTRNGFVSNSSSSSFIVMFPEQPKSEQDVRDMLFPRFKKDITIYDMTMSADEAANIVWSDIQSDDSKMTKKAIKEQFESLYYHYLFSITRENSCYCHLFNNEYYTDVILQDKEILKELEVVYEKEQNIWRTSTNMSEEERIKQREEIFKLREEYDKLEKRAFEVDFKKFLDKNKGKFIRILHYSDNDSQVGAIMEHAGIFNNLEHIRISHH